MSLFIAILDDDPADRKQSERLLSRERDKRIANGEVIYFDSYGSREAIISCCSRYDLILVDITQSSPDGFMAAVDLFHNGAKGQIVLASSKIDYRSRYGDFEDFVFIDKPLYQKDVKALVDLAYSHKEKQTKKIELRGREKTVYSDPKDIIYLRQSNGFMIAAIDGGINIKTQESLSQIIQELDPGSFLKTDENTVIGMSHVVSRDKNTFRMSDGALIRFSIFNKRRILKAWEAYALRRMNEEGAGSEKQDGKK